MNADATTPERRGKFSAMIDWDQLLRQRSKEPIRAERAFDGRAGVGSRPCVRRRRSAATPAGRREAAGEING
jgi:hypothetical protein